MSATQIHCDGRADTVQTKHKQTNNEQTPDSGPPPLCCFRGPIRRSLTDRLAQVELSLLFHYLDTRSALQLSRCDRTLLSAACVPFSWAHAEPPLVLSSAAQLQAALSSRIMLRGGVPVTFDWSGGDIVDPAQCLTQLQSLRVRALDLTAWRGFGDAAITQLVAHPSLRRCIRRVRVGGYHNQVSSDGLRALCVGLPHLTALSVDHVVDAAAVAVAAQAPALPDADAHVELAANHHHHADAIGDDDYEPLRDLHLAPCLQALELRRWLAEELTAASLRHVAQLSGLRRLYLENLESFAATDLRTFFSSPMARGLQLLSLSHVNFRTDNVAEAFAGTDRDEIDAAGAAAADVPEENAAQPDWRAALDMWRGMEQLESLSLIRCRNIFAIVPQICAVPRLRTLVIRGALDSWGVEVPKREDLLRMVGGARALRRLVLLVHTSNDKDMANLRAQLGSVERVDFRDGAAETINPDAFERTPCVLVSSPSADAQYRP